MQGQPVLESPRPEAVDDRSALLPPAEPVTRAGSSSAWQVLALGGDDGRDHLRKRCYIRTVSTITSVNLAGHTFTAHGILNMFWEDEKFPAWAKQAQELDVRRGSVGTKGVYQAVTELEDDGESLPINPDNMFSNQLSLEHPAAAKLLFDFLTAEADQRC